MIPAHLGARWNMASAVSSGVVFRFGLFEVDVAHRTLSRKGVRVRLQDQPFRALVLLLQDAGGIVTREELRRQLWPEGTYVDFDGSLNVILKKLRAAIGDDPENPVFVETVPRQGYRFIAPVAIDAWATAPQPTKVEPESEPSPATSSGLSIPARHVRPPMTVALAGLLLLLAASGWWYFLRYRSVVHAAPKVIAVLPFSNEGAGPEFDYLRYAIGNDLVTDLSHARSVSVRPFSSSSSFATQPRDMSAIGRELHVSHVVTGSFLLDQRSLRVDLELIDVAQNEVVWRDEVQVGPQELIALHDKLADSATRHLLPAMNIAGLAGNEIPAPKNEEAFDLFMHSEEVPLDPGPNQMAIKKLEQSVSIDGGYAPAWGQLGWRYYIDYHYGNGGDAAKAKLLHAFQRQFELDPNAPPWITVRVEQGDLDGAYRQMADLLQKRPDFSGGYFGMSYVLRYAGLLDEAATECDATFALDPVGGYRSCATTFILSGDYAHAQRFIDLDRASGFAALARMEIALRQGNKDAVMAEANTAIKLGYSYADAKLARVCLSHPSEPELAKAVAELESDPVSSRDPELLFQNAEASAFCGQQDAALRELRKAVQGNYCSYPAMDKDPLFDSIRQRAEFAELRQAGIECQQNFTAHRAQVDHSASSVK